MKKKIAEDRVVDIVVYILLALIGIITLYPFYYTVICSFNDGLDLMKGGVYLWPRKFTLANFELFLGDEEWQHAFMVSVARTVVGAALRTGFTSIFSYRNNLCKGRLSSHHSEKISSPITRQKQTYTVISIVPYAAGRSKERLQGSFARS